MFADILGRGSGFVPPPEMFVVPFHSLGPIRCFLGWVDGIPAACSMLHAARGSTR
jgi:hypothetical protein